MMNTTRRNLLQLAGGAVAGTAISPIPYRLLNSVTVRTQNEPWAPAVPRGPITYKASNCTLCAGGCATRVRCAGAVPIGIQPAGEPLCPAAFAGHQFAFHPQRLRTVLHRGTPSNLQNAIAALKGPIAVLDLAPGRTASLLHRWHLSKIAGSLYIEAPSIEGATAQAISRLLKNPVKLAIDFEHAKTVLSLATPIFEGWAPLRHVLRHDAMIMQVESQQSHTGELADRWLRDIDLTSLPELEKPAIVLADGDPANGPRGRSIELAAALLNIRLGSVGVAGGFLPVAETPVPNVWAGVHPTSLENVPDGSISTLIIDEPTPGCALNWSAVERKLAKGAVVVACTWTQSRNADWQIPCPVYLETLQDTTPAPSTAEADFRLSAQIMTPPEQTIDAATFIGMLAGDDTPYARRIEERAAAIHASGKGSLNQRPIREVDWKDFWSALNEGGRWHDVAPGAAKLEFAALPDMPRIEKDNRDSRVPGWRPAAASPLLAKLWQDTDLKAAPGSARKA